MPQLTPEQIADVEARHAQFMPEYEALCQKYQMKIGSMPTYVRVNDNGYITHIELGPVDLKYLPTPSPLNGPAIQKS